MENFNRSQKITPKDILIIFQNIRKAVSGVEKYKVNQDVLYNSLNDLLSTNNVNFLIACNDVDINKEIISESLRCCESLEGQYASKIYPKLTLIAGSDNETLRKIYAYSNKGLKRSTFSRYKGIIALIAMFFVVYIVSRLDNNSSPARTPYTPDNGELDHEFAEKNSAQIENIKKIEPPTSNKIKANKISEINTELPEPKPIINREIQPQIKSAKEVLIAEGWEETMVSDGQLPSCYNFIPKKSNIDNYLEVQVGGGTDVAIKVMDLKTDKCIRYVFINSRSSYKIRNIPEGIYYLKIAYGKDWFSKVENGKCIGKFISSPMYEKGDELMDFNFQYTSDGFQIPSYELELDVISSNTINSFSTANISELEFNE